MALFSKKTEETNQPPRNPNNTVMFRLLAIGYVVYMCCNIIKLYMEGGPDAPSLTALVLGVGLLGAGAIFMGVISYKEWKRNKAAYDSYMAELRAEAEAKRAAEEAEEDTDFEDDEDLYLPEETEE